MSPGRSLLALLCFPGLLYAVPMGFLMLGLERKLRARLQRRLGPPLAQPFLDVVKLLAKQPVARAAGDAALLGALPVVAVGTITGALALLPVGGRGTGFAGDLVLLVALLEVPPLCLVLAGYASRSIYGEVGATREALLGIVSSVPFLGAVLAMAAACGSLHLAAIATATPWAVRLPAVLAILLCLPARLRMNPFSVSNAEQEILAGPLTEQDGRRLALWELAHALELVALAGLVVTLALPALTGGALHALVFALASGAVIVPLTALASATGRLRLDQAARWLWRWPTLMASAALAMAFVERHGGR
ncbi:MAG TPA: complex I subunit 1 family protein [Anaeromyxobacteraceae bacterium]|nr:complex I subunit 1 family protein [Anaeromyxobacteraceae bacterium]